MKKTNVFEKYQFLIAAVIIVAVVVYSNKRDNFTAKETVRVDTVFVENGKTIDSLQNELNLLNEEIARTTKMSVREQQAAAAVYQIKYFIDITEKRPANKTFFFGWVKRAIKEFIDYDKTLNEDTK